MFCGHTAITLRRTLASTTPWPRLPSFAEAAEVARRSRAQQQKVRWRVFELRDPSTIIPNHPTLRPYALLTPTASTHSHSHAPCGQHSPLTMETAGRAARPKDIFYLHVAGGQVVGSAGGADGVLFSGSWALLAGPRRDLGLQRPSDGGRGDGRAPDRPSICESIYILVFFCTI